MWWGSMGQWLSAPVVKTLIILDMAMFAGIALLQEIGAIPNDLWVQFPLLLLGGVLVGYLAKAHLHEQEKWRSSLIDEQTKSREFLQHMIQEERATLLKIIESMQTGHDKNTTAVLASQKEAYDEVIERVIDAVTRTDIRKAQ
jgi:hypothetical protein